MIKVLINGINGKMGQVLLNEINNTDNMEVVKGITRNDNLDDIKEQVDVIIDFSTPEGTFNILEFANKKNIPVVIATTGFTKEEQDKILAFSKNIPIFQSSNMSFEINLMCDLVAKLATQLTNSDIEIVETHHRNKVDAPSGTALMLANSIKAAKDDVEYVYDRHSIKQKRKDNEIGISSIRGGTEVGKHTVYFFGDNESFEITHTVNSRSIFAKGSMKAAEYLIKQPKGFYNMKDLIKGDN